MASTYNITIRAKGGIDKYPAKAHARRVAQELGHKVSVIVLRGEQKAYFSNSDQYRVFRQDRYFYYLTGSNDPGCWMTYHTHSDTLTLWLPPVDLKRAFYEGRATTTEEALDRYDIDEARYLKGKKAKSNLAQYISDACSVGQCAAAKIPRVFLGDRIMKSLTDESFNLGLLDAMKACRAVKDVHEIALIRKANEITAEAHLSVLKNLPRLKSEAEAFACYTSVCLSRKSRFQSYAPIIGSGPNAAQLDYNINTDDFGDRETLLLDAGAEWECYASDVTRTMPINRENPGYWQSGEAEQIHNIVQHIQETCIKMMKPGAKFYDVAWKSSNMALDALLDIGILKGNRADIMKAGTWQAFFPHGLGHHVGLEVHDLPPPLQKGASRPDKDFNAEACSAIIPSSYRDPTCSSKKKLTFKPTVADAPLAPGMILTIEPGLYFNRMMLDAIYLPHKKHSQFINQDVLEKYFKVGGVRIEDDILITEDGYENLTTAPKGEEMLKIIRDAAAGCCRQDQRD